MAEITTTFDPKHDLTERVIVGNLSAEEILAVFAASHPDKVSKLILWDLSKASLASVTTGEVARIAETLGAHTKYRRKGKSAVVATSDLEFGFTRMYQFHRESQRIQVPFRSFRVRQDALDWLLSDGE